MVEFMMSHMMKKLPIELFLLNVGITHRLLCYQKRNSVRLPYNWKDLWAALIALAKFLVTNEAYLAKKMNIFQLANQVSLWSHFKADVTLDRIPYLMEVDYVLIVFTFAGHEYLQLIHHLRRHLPIHTLKLR